MNSENSQKYSTMDEAVGRSNTDAAGNSSNQCVEIETQTTSDVNLNEFLDLLNLSCHMNEMITQGDVSQQLLQYNHNESSSNVTNARKSNNAKSDAAAATIDVEVNFQKLAENRLVNELLGHKSKQTRIKNDERTDSTTGSGDNFERDQSRRHSNLGTTESIYYTRHSTTHKAETPTTTGLHVKLNQKLDYVINEGVLDAVLPFICPVPVPTKYSARAAKLKPKTAASEAAGMVAGDGDGTDAGVRSDLHEQQGSGGSDGGIMSKDKIGRRKMLMNAKTHGSEKKEPEVTIHVLDEVKHASRDFTCPQSVLVSKMGYFADVTAGQRLEDIDISVHCDIKIFDWLMRWVKFSCSVGSMHNSGALDTFSGPQLNAGNVVPILVSASFLQMEPLLLDCLSYCHANLNDVVRSSTNLSCFNDVILTRLAAMFTNSELEAVRDKKERLAPRLWTKLIQSLCEQEPEALRGHYYSLAGLFRCSKCGMHLTNSIKSYISCVPSNVRLNRWGQLVSYHLRDSGWNINSYIMQLYRELKSWRKVYWKLWGHCHVLYCCTCETHFQAYQMTWCRFHPEHANYLGPISEGCMAGPTGRYPCCSHQSFRYETLPGPNGCHFREHSVLVETDRERAILTTCQLVSESYALYDNPPPNLHELITSDVVEPRWLGLSLLPQRCRQGLLPELDPEQSSSKLARNVRHYSTHCATSSTESDTSSTVEESEQQRRRTRRSVHKTFPSSSDGAESDYVAPKAAHSKKCKKRPTEVPGRYWSGEVSARSNQDHQREFEEKVMKQVIALVGKKTSSDQSISQNTVSVGGSYLRLEAEWREQLKQRHTNNNGNANAHNISCSNLTNSRTKQHK